MALQITASSWTSSKSATASRKSSLGRRTAASSSSRSKSKSKTARKKKSTAAKKKRSKRATAIARKKGEERVKEKQIEPQGDKYEVSPNGRAKCKSCKRTIEEGQVRVGKETHCERFGFFFRYFHDKCYPAEKRKELQLASGCSPAEELARHKKQEKQKEKLLRKRADLRQSLTLLRLAFAQRLNVSEKSAWLVFREKTIDELTVHMPRNRAEMLVVKGIGPKVFRNFGEPILEVIRYYRNRYQDQRAETNIHDNNNVTTRRVTIKRQSATVSPPSSSDATGTAAGRITRSKRKTVVIDVDDSDDEDAEDAIVMGESLSCEEIVRRKFEHAASKGYIISLDDNEEDNNEDIKAAPKVAPKEAPKIAPKVEPKTKSKRRKIIIDDDDDDEHEFDWVSSPQKL